MSGKKLIPVFTKKVAKQTVDYVVNMIIPNLQGVLSREMCHIVVLVSSMVGSQKYPNYTIRPHVIYEHSLGNPEEWPRDFKDIAQCKALQLWHERNDGRTDCMPHLLFSEDTHYYGGVKRDGIVVACSGFQPYFDKMISGIVADMCIAMAYDKYMLWKKDNPDKPFV